MNTALLEIKDVSLTFPGNEKNILSSINYKVFAGDSIIILGSNGSGKSSLLKLIDRRYQASQGQLYFSNQSLGNIPPSLFYGQVKSLTQNCHESLFTSLTVFENYLLTRKRSKNNAVNINLKQERKFLANYLESFNPNLPLKLDQVSLQLSGGEKQALALALTVLTPPKLLLLDEHTSALDPKSSENIMRITHKVVSEHKITCLMTTHDLSVAEEYGNRILSLKNGRIHQMIESGEKNKVQLKMDTYG